MVFQHMPPLSDHYMITFEFPVCDFTPLGKHFYSRCLPEDTVNKFKELIHQHLDSVPCLNRSDGSLANLSYSQINQIVDSADSV